MKLLIGLAEFLGLIASQSEELDTDAYGVGAVMPYDLSTLTLSESMRRD